MAEYPTAWIQTDEASVALGNLDTTTILALAKRDKWRRTTDHNNRTIYAIDDVRATAQKERTTPTAPPTPTPPTKRGRTVQPPHEQLTRALRHLTIATHTEEHQ